MNNPFAAIDRDILADSGTSDETAQNLFTLCDEIGARFAGTAGYRRAADFMLGKFREYDLDLAELEDFEFTAWRRGEPARFSMRTPLAKAINCYAFPYGAATGPNGVEAGIVDIGAGTRDDIDEKRRQIKNRFVLTNGTGDHRRMIYEQCVALGAAGFILHNSRNGMQLATGSVGNGDAGSVPAIGIAHESGLLIQRLTAENPDARFHLFTDGTCEPAVTWNVIGELAGSEHPDELVIIGGHLDSHDIGPGAFDNAAGAVLVMEVARLLAKQRKHLIRTVRFIGFAAEEVGLLGSRYHAQAHADELRRARFMQNCDTPSLGNPKGIAFHRCPRAKPYMETLSRQMNTPLVCQNRNARFSDHYPFILQGVPTAGVGAGKFAPATQHYVHMAADTPDKISVTDLRDTAAFLARFLLRAASDPHWPDMRRTEKEIDTWRQTPA